MMKTLLIILAAIFIPLFICLVVLSIIDRFSKSTWFCRAMGWHKTPVETGFDGCSCTGICPRCRKPVMQDGQGNWF